MDRDDNTNPCQRLLFVLGFCVAFVLPEILIFGFDAEARSDWTRMLPVAVFAPLTWTFALAAFAFGIYFIGVSFRALAAEPKATGEHVSSFAICGCLLYPGARVPVYWVKRIVFDDVPAFGYNPDNIYAVAGLNSVAFGIVWAVSGAVAGVIIGAVLSFITRGIAGAAS